MSSTNTRQTNLQDHSKYADEESWLAHPIAVNGNHRLSSSHNRTSTIAWIHLTTVHCDWKRIQRSLTFPLGHMPIPARRLTTRMMERLSRGTLALKTQGLCTSEIKVTTGGLTHGKRMHDRHTHQRRSLQRWKVSRARNGSWVDAAALLRRARNL